MLKFKSIDQNSSFYREIKTKKIKLSHQKINYAPGRIVRSLFSNLGYRNMINDDELEIPIIPKKKSSIFFEFL